MPILLHQLLVHVLLQLAPLERYRRAPQQHEAVERRRAGDENPLADVGATPAPPGLPPTEGEGGAGGEAEEGAREEVVGREPGDEAAEEVVEGEMEIVELGPEGQAEAAGRLEPATLVDAELAGSEGARGGRGGRRRAAEGRSGSGGGSSMGSSKVGLRAQEE
ncbi:hypothetical protein NL676_035971 [Syzygium grande]|nr:hypothetical protein NL676_035971 [Syzygium grande]